MRTAREAVEERIEKATEGPESIWYAVDRMRRVLALAEGDLLRFFLTWYRETLREEPPPEVVTAIGEGRIEDALAYYVSERVVTRLSNRPALHFVRAGEDVARFLGEGLGVVVDFDAINPRAVDKMRAARLRFIREFTDEARSSVREALVDGARRGVNPRVMAREFRDSIGLTQRQNAAVANYRRLLEQRSSAALSRQLRDRRFDGTLRRAIKTKTALPPEQVERMVGRYRERYLAYRAETIARSEALRSVHEGNAEMFRQAYDSGILNEREVVRTWHTAHDERVRSSHSYLAGQERADDEPFLSGNGNLIRWPGDEEASGSETVKCRCAVSVRVRRRRLRRAA
jgi:hypothetical protein